MNLSRCSFSCRFVSLFCSVLAVLGWSLGPSLLAIDDAATQQIWKLKYGVTDAQIADPAWLAKDDDGDGVTNGGEMAAGTNPFDATKTINVTRVAKNGSNTDLQFPTEPGKLYRVQCTTTLTNANSWAFVGGQLTGDGTSKTLSVPYTANAFYRIFVSDIDTDGDGLSDWAEKAVGLNPNSAQSVTGTDDHAYVQAQVAMPNVVTISAPDSFASEDGPSAGKLTVTRTQNLFPLTVNYGVSGTAVPSTDYTPLPGSVTFAARGATTADIFVNPMVQSTLKGSRSVTAALAPAPAGTAFPFTLGNQNQATVIINSSTAATGTGLLAQYFDSSSGTYADAANFGQSAIYNFTRNTTPTTAGSIVVAYWPLNLSALQVGNVVKLSFTSGNLNTTPYNNANYTVTAVTSSTFTVGITNAAGLPSSGAGSCNLQVQSFANPPAVQRIEPTVNFDWQYGTPNGVTIAPNNSVENYSATWEGYLSPTTAGAYIFQLDADTKARVLLDLNDGNGLTQILEHNWANPGADAVGTFKQSAAYNLAVPATPAARYRMRVEHVETTGDARCRLQWNVNGGSFANIPQANVYSHTQAMTYSHQGGNLTITPTGGHSYVVGNVVPLSFSSGVLFTPGAPASNNKNYTITAVNGTTSFTVPMVPTSATISVTGATTTASSATVTVPSTTGLGLVPGMGISGGGLPAGEYITAVGATSITVSTATGVTASTGATLTVVSNPSVPVSVVGASTAAGSNTITVPSTAGLVVGMAITGTGLPAGEFITGIGAGSITVTTGTGVTAQASTSLTAISSVSTSATTLAGNATITVPSTAGLAIGMAVIGTGLPANEFITAIPNGTTFTVTTGTGVTAQASTTLTAFYPGMPIAISGASMAAGGNIINVPDTSGLAVGMLVNGPGLPAAEVITAIGVSSTAITTGTGVTAQSNATLTAFLPITTATGSGFILNTPASTTTGVYNLCYANTAFANAPGRVGVDSAVTSGNNGIWNSGTPDPSIQPDSFSARWTGQVQPEFSEDYTFTVTADDAVSLWINGQLQPMKLVSSASTGTATYTYEAATGNTVVNYSSMIIPPGTFLLGESVRLDPTSGNLSHGPTNSPTYTYDATTGNVVVDYTNILVGQPGGTVVAGSFAVGQLIEVDPITGPTSALSTAAYPITAVAGNTFTVNFGPGLYATGAGNITIADTRNATITKLYSTGSAYTYTAATGALVVDYSNLTGVPAGAFPVGSSVELDPASGNLAAIVPTSYTVTATTGTTFTVNVGINLYTNASTGTVNIAAPAGGPIPVSLTSAFTVNFGAGRYADLSTGNASIDIVNKTLKEWSSNTNERFCRLPMIGGVRYDIRLEYYEGTGASRCFLSWYSPSQTKQIIPQERLYPTSVPQAPPSHISATDVSGLVNGLFTYQVGASNGATVSVTGNPAWLTYSGGVLSGTPPPGAAGDYQVIITATNSAGTSTSVVNLHVDQNAGTVPREYWNGVSGSTVASIPTSTAPTGTTTLTSLQGPSNSGTNFGARVRGYITAPTTGNYYFWIAANNAAELWISNDSEPVNIFKRASVSTGSATPQNWTNEASQKSPWLALEQGQKYYFEVLHKAGAAAGDNLAVGWSKPGEDTTAPSQVVPGYVLSPYVAPALGSTPGTLYIASMLSQNAAVTNGVGNSTLRLSDDESTAYMTRSYSGLTGAITSEHIHTDPYLTKPSTIVFDIDAPVTAGDGLITNPADPHFTGTDPQLGTYKWTILPVGTLTKADIVEIIKEGKAYINLHTAAYPAGEIRGNYTLADGTRTFAPPPAPPAWTDDHTTDAGAQRFLTQATFGANIAEIQALKGMASYEAWIDDQFTKSATPHLPEVKARELGDVFGAFDTSLSFNTWWKTSMTAPDQLRQRVAFALSEIHVLSGQGPLQDNSLAISHFYDTLLSNAFGNFRDLLISTTLTPGMGRYLDMWRNDKPDLTIGRSPNENYAREIKQLFSIGLYRLWPDGTLMLTSTDTPIDTYTQREIVGLAHVFTGWDYGYDGPYRTSLGSATDWTRQMRETPLRHFTGKKRVLNNQVMPGLLTLGGQTLDPYATHISSQYNDPAYQALPSQELNAVHDMLFNHPNVGPFICRQLIQRMVTSNPSRDYLYRVVQKFNDNGSGVRGDMKAVIKAILLDYEARSTDLLAIPAFGKQREPIMRVAQAARAFRPAGVTGTYSQNGTSTITITTSTPHLLTAGNNVFLEFTDATPVTSQLPPTTGSYAVVSVTDATHYSINAPGWLVGSYAQTAGSSTMTVTMSGHYLPGTNASQPTLPAANFGQAYFDFLTATSGTQPADGVRPTVSSTSFDTPSTVGNTSGTTFTIAAPDTTARAGSVMISRFGGSYSCTGRNGVITIDTNYGGAGTYGTMANHGLNVGDTVFLNFTGSRDSTSGAPTSTNNDLAYTVATVPDANTFTVAARDAADAAMGSDNQVVVFPLKTQPLVRNGTINTRPSTFAMGTTDTDLDQTPLNSPTVFNFFLPSYKYAGALASQGITTPEFQLTAETTVIRQSNYLYAGVFGSTSTTTGTSSFATGNNALVLDLTPWQTSTAANLGLGAAPQPTQAWTSNANVGTLIDQLNTLLLSGQLPAAAKTAIQNLLGSQITSITSATTGNACTFNMSSAHGLQVGDSVTVTGITGGTWSGASTSGNGTFFVTAVPTTTSFKLATATTGGTNLACTSTSGLVLTSSNAGIIPYTNASPTTTNIRDRVRAIVHLILTSPDYTIQR
jgi:uncharacterized protein (DUF1800 family)